MLSEAAMIHVRYTTGGCPTIGAMPAAPPSVATAATVVMTQITAAFRRQDVSRQFTRAVRKYLPWFARPARRPRRSLADRTTEIVSR